MSTASRGSTPAIHAERAMSGQAMSTDTLHRRITLWPRSRSWRTFSDSDPSKRMIPTVRDTPA